MSADSTTYETKLSELGFARDFFAAELEDLSPADQVFLSIWTFYQEFYNGGFWQYFANSSGRLVPSLVSSLRAIGFAEGASIAQEAVSQVDSGVVWEDEEDRTSKVYRLSNDVRNRLWDLGGRFNPLLDEMMKRLFEYLSRHRSEVDAPADFWTEPEQP
jgi:hypothetical protein